MNTLMKQRMPDGKCSRGRWSNVARVIMALLTLTTTATLTSCGVIDNSEGAPYDVTLYSGGSVVREWSGVSNYVRWGDVCTGIEVDGESVTIIGGALVIERGGSDGV